MRGELDLADWQRCAAITLLTPGPVDTAEYLPSTWPGGLHRKTQPALAGSAQPITGHGRRMAQWPMPRSLPSPGAVAAVVASLPAKIQSGLCCLPRCTSYSTVSRSSVLPARPADHPSLSCLPTSKISLSPSARPREQRAHRKHRLSLSSISRHRIAILLLCRGRAPAVPSIPRIPSTHAPTPGTAPPAFAPPRLGPRPI